MTMDKCNNISLTELLRKKTIYFVRHAEAIHNVKEKKAVQEARDKKGEELTKCEQEKARKSALHDPLLTDAPLSDEGVQQTRFCTVQLSVLMNKSSSSSSCTAQYKPPEVVLVSPLRRALMTATELFVQNHNRNHHHGGNDSAPPRLIAVEALREKRTGLACDERSSLETLKAEFPHVDFSDVQRNTDAVPVGEDNNAVRARGRIWMEKTLPFIDGDSVAVVSHKGWLREMQHTLQSWGHLNDGGDKNVVYGNAEIRIHEFCWKKQPQQNHHSRSCPPELVSVVARSISNAIANVVDSTLLCREQIEKAQSLANTA